MRAGRRRQLGMRLAIVAAMSAALAGCSLKLRVEVFNDTGEAVTVGLDRVRLSIAPGASARLDYPGAQQRWMLFLTTATCKYAYAVPRTLEHVERSARGDAPLEVQIEKDFSIHLLPRTARAIAPVEGFASLQQDGFPLRPASRSCH
jgi:hypothetical protein